jgi:hypothetical protein
MKLTPVAGPLPPPTINETARREKMMTAFNKSAEAQKAQAQPQPQSQETSVANPNKISPEELSAIRPKSQDVDNLAQTEDTPVQPEVEQPAPKVERDPALSRQFAQLAKQERQLRAKAQQQEQQIKAREAELAAKEEAIKAREQEYTQGYISKDQLKQDTLRILADSGVSYDELTQQILNQRDTDPRVESYMKRLEAKIADLEAKAKQSESQAQESQQQAYKAAIKQIETDIRQLVANDPSYEVIKSTRSIPDVVELIEEVYKKDGIVMSVEEACNEVEKYLSDEAMKLTRIGKIKRQLEQAGQPKPTQTAKVQQTQNQMKTLTNAAASTRKLSAKERAILAFRNELKS